MGLNLNYRFLMQAGKMPTEPQHAQRNENVGNPTSGSTTHGRGRRRGRLSLYVCACADTEEEQPASHEEGCGDCRVEMPSRDPRGRIDQHSQAKTVANGGGRQPGAHRVGVTPSPKEGEEEHADEFGEHAA